MVDRDGTDVRARLHLIENTQAAETENRDNLHKQYIERLRAIERELFGHTYEDEPKEAQAPERY